jgi:hypothetical protein
VWVSALEEAARIQKRSNERRSTRVPGERRGSVLAILHYVGEG